jgi:hypothetical protein
LVLVISVPDVGEYLEVQLQELRVVDNRRADMALCNKVPAISCEGIMLARVKISIALPSFRKPGGAHSRRGVSVRHLHIGAQAMLLSPVIASPPAPGRGWSRLFSVRKIGLAFNALVGWVSAARKLFRRLDERRR